MQFSYAVSEADYLNAWKIRRRGLIGSRAVLKTILFWVFVLVCLMLVWGVVQRSQTKDPVQPAQETTSVSGNPWENVLPFSRDRRHLGLHSHPARPTKRAPLVPERPGHARGILGQDHARINCGDKYSWAFYASRVELL